METIKTKDFIEIDYTGRLADGNVVFDTTSEEIAKKNNIISKDVKYGPVVICVGEQQVLKGIDSNLLGKEIGREYSFDIAPADGFGKKDPQLLKLVPSSIFKKQNINPVPGMQVDIDGIIGLVRTATGGRIIVDFNHPFSGKELIYQVKLNRLVESKEEKISAYLKMVIGIEVGVSVKEDKATITIETNIPQEYKTEIEKKIKDLVGVSDIIFEQKKPENTAKKTD